MSAARRNPTRFDLVDRIEELIAEYNAGSLNALAHSSQRGRSIESGNPVSR